MKRLPVVGVMGSGTKRYAERASRVGAWVARSGYHLLTGGGPGVMGAVTEAFVSVSPRAGLAYCQRVLHRPGTGHLLVIRIDGLNSLFKLICLSVVCKARTSSHAII